MAPTPTSSVSNLTYTSAVLAARRKKLKCHANQHVGEIPPVQNVTFFFLFLLTKNYREEINVTNTKTLQECECPRKCQQFRAARV